MAQLSNLELTINGECLYCRIRMGSVFEQISAEDFAYDFQEAGFSLIRDYWTRSNKTPSIRYKVRLLRRIVTTVLERQREHEIRTQRIRSHSF